MHRNKNEKFIEYCQRLTKALDNKEISYSEWAQDLFGDTGYSDETLRRASKVFNLFLKKLIVENIEDISDKEILFTIQREREELNKERKKIQTENLQYVENQRWEARNELFQEKIADAISRLEPIIPRTVNTYARCNLGVSGLLCVYDLHAGSTYEIKGIYNEVVNKYDFEIMESRMWYLLKQMVDDYMPFEDLTIVFGGDLIENMLRLSSLTKLKEPVIDTVIKLSEFLSQWVVKVYDNLNVPINVVVIGGNHDINRPLVNKKQFTEENFAKIICEFMKLRLKDQKEIIVDDYCDCAIKTIRKTNIIFEHGEADPITTMDYFSNLYSIDIDEGYFGHLHRQESKSAGIADVGDRMAYRVGSICGVDGYAKQLRKANRASATFATYTENGREWAKTYYLN